MGQFAAANSEPACWLGVLLWCPLPPHRRRAVPDGVFHLAGGGQVLLIPCALPQKTSLSGSRVRGSAPLIVIGGYASVRADHPFTNLLNRRLRHLAEGHRYGV